jgi:hypothetical protein
VSEQTEERSEMQADDRWDRARSLGGLARASRADTAQQELPFAPVKAAVNHVASTDTFPSDYGSTVRMFYARQTTTAPWSTAVACHSA